MIEFPIIIQLLKGFKGDFKDYQLGMLYPPLSCLFHQDAPGPAAPRYIDYRHLKTGLEKNIFA
jgi:hypothetical protein